MRSGQKTPVRTGNTLRRRWAWPPSGLLRYAPPRLRAAEPSETLAPGAESTYNNNQPNGDLSELTKKRLSLAPLSAPPLTDDCFQHIFG